MFHEQYINQQENMHMLDLYNWKLLERTPSSMSESIYSYTINHSRMRGNAVEHVELKVLPQVQLRAVRQLTDSIRKGQRGQKLSPLAAMFRLGLGVPRLATVARYLEAYEQSEDPDSSTIKVICDLVESHVAKLEEATDNFGYVPYARYLDHMYNFSNVVSKEVKGETVRSRTVPNGIPVVLIYKLKSAESSNFVLAGGFRFTEKGFPINFDHIICRPSFKAAPKNIKSKSLQVHCNYVLVTGVMTMVGRDYTLEHLKELGHHTEDILLADSKIVKNTKHKQEQQVLDKLNVEIYEARQFISKYEGSTVPKSKRKQHKRYEKFLGTEEVRKYARSRERLEGKIVKDLQVSGPVTKCRFYALDLGLIKNYVDFQHVKTKLSKVEEFLKHIGFNLASEKEGTKKIRMHTTKQKTRIWSI